jgi:hypothetical protein
MKQRLDGPHLHQSEQLSLSNTVLIDPAHDPRWNAFVEGHPFGLICHLAVWKEILEKSFPHMKGYYLALLDKDNQSIRAALPVFAVKSLLTGRRMVSIPFASNCDPLISSNEDMVGLLEVAVNLAATLRCPSIEIRALKSCPLMKDTRLCSVVHNKGHEIPLEETPEALIKKLSGKTRWTIKKSMASGFDVHMADDEGALLAFYDLYAKTRRRLGLPLQPYQFFYLQWEKLSQTKNISLLAVRFKGRLAAGLLIFKFKDRFSCEYLGADERFKYMKINYFVFWEAIKAAYAEGYKIFDLGRTGISNQGLMDFKGRWGTTVIDLPQFFYPATVCERLNSKEESFPYKIIRTINRNAPEPVFRMVGKFLYKHLG